MPKGPTGQKRPADVASNAVHIMQIATGQVVEDQTMSAAAQFGKKGGSARAKAISKRKRKAIAKAAALARWSKEK